MTGFIHTDVQLDAFFKKCVSEGAANCWDSNALMGRKPFIEGFERATPAIDEQEVQPKLREASKQLLTSLGVVLEKDNIVLCPDSLTVLNAHATKAAVRPQHENPVILLPYGNFRRNFRNESLSGAKRDYVDFDRTTLKVTPELLEQAIIRAQTSGKTPVAFQLEDPSNPFMQCYRDAEKKALLEMAAKHNVVLIQDIYLSGAQSPSLTVTPITEIAKEIEGGKAVVTCGVRRRFGLDENRFGVAYTNDDTIYQAMHDATVTMPFDKDKIAKILHVLDATTRSNPNGWQSNDVAHQEVLEQYRTNAETAVTRIPEITLLAKAEAGPFIVFSFTDEVIDKKKH